MSKLELNPCCPRCKKRNSEFWKKFKNTFLGISFISYWYECTNCSKRFSRNLEINNVDTKRTTMAIGINLP
jgi:hypothetical protein